MAGFVKHKDYIGAIDIDVDAGCLYATAIGMRDVITAQGATVAELNTAFAESVEDYLAFCEEDGVAPEAPVSGKLHARIGATMHYRLKRIAGGRGASMNDELVRLLRAQIEREEDDLGIGHDVPESILAMEAARA
jgi:predicted HicB family RNase H-like nuclease